MTSLREQRRLKLHALLKSVCDNVYYRKPSTVLNYPCIVYDRTLNDIRKADNRGYYQGEQYQLTLIEMDPISKLEGFVEDLFDGNISIENDFYRDKLLHTIINVYIN